MASSVLDANSVRSVDRADSLMIALGEWDEEVYRKSPAALDFAGDRLTTGRRNPDPFRINRIPIECRLRCPAVAYGVLNLRSRSVQIQGEAVLVEV